MAQVVAAASVPSDGAAFTRAQMRRAVWVLEVFAVVPLRWASEALDAVTADGLALRLAGGLEVNYTESVQWFGGAGEPDADFSGLRPPPGLDLAQLLFEGHPFDSSEATLSLWDPEGIWENRIVKLRGTVRGARVGGLDEPLSFNVRARRRGDLPKEPTPDQRITTDTWAEDTLPGGGDNYPIVYGFPGHRRFVDIGTPFGKLVSRDLEGGSPSYVVRYEGEKQGVDQGELSGAYPEEGTEPGLVFGLAMAGHAFNSEGRILDRLRRYNTSSRTGGAAGVGDMTWNSSVFAFVSVVVVNFEDLAGQLIDDLTPEQFIGTEFTYRHTVGQRKDGAYTIDTAVKGADSWTFGVSVVDGSIKGAGSVTVGNDFRLSFTLNALPGQSTVDVLNTTRENSRASDLSLIATFDLLGQPVTVVELTSQFLGEDPWVLEDELWILWDQSDGATMADRAAHPLRGGGELCEYILRRGGVDVDTAAWQGVKQEVNDFLFDTFRDEPQDGWEYVTGSILPLLPLGTLASPRGVAPVLWRWDISEVDAAAHIIEGVLGIERRGQPAIDEDWSNAVRVRFSPQTDGGTFREEVAVIGVPLLSDTQRPSAGTLSSVASRGLREARVVEAVAVGDRGTASRVAATVAARFGSPADVVDLRDKQSSWSHVPIGAVVAYSDSELGWSKRLGVLTSRRWIDGWNEIRVLFTPITGAL